MAENIWGKTIRSAAPSIVTIVISKNAKAVKADLSAEMMAMPPEAREQQAPDIPPDAIDAHGMVKIGSGSGFVADPSGIILTNKHVIADPKATYEIVTNDDVRHPAEVVARDPIDDIAILRIKGVALPALPLGDSDNIELGQPVLAIGNALGIFKNTVSSGIVSGLNRSIQAMPDPKAGPQEMRGLIQTDTAINPGNSGGPLFDETGRVIGVNAAIVFGAQNLSFSIPINAAKRDLADILKYGRIRRPLLGLRYVMIDEMAREKMNLPIGYGALISSQGKGNPGVIPQSPADKAGLKDGDIILACGGEKLEKGKVPQDFLDDKDVGDTLKLTVLRNKKTIEVPVTLAERTQ